MTTTRVGESTLRERDGPLGVNLGSSTNRNDEGTSAREGRLKYDLILAVVGLARTTSNTEIARGEQDGDTTSAELSKCVADTDGVIEWNRLFVVVI